MYSTDEPPAAVLELGWHLGQTCFSYSMMQPCACHMLKNKNTYIVQKLGVPCVSSYMYASMCMQPQQTAAERAYVWLIDVCVCLLACICLPGQLPAFLPAAAGPSAAAAVQAMGCATRQPHCQPPLTLAHAVGELLMDSCLQRQFQCCPAYCTSR
jgi:hypothetical protein